MNFLQDFSTTFQILSNVRSEVSHLRDLTQENILIQRMAGRTNQTYKVSMINSCASPVIYRKFGQSDSNVFLDRETERVIYQHVSQEQLGPKIYCYIGNTIRIQEFIESRTLKNKQTLQVQTIENVAFTLRKFHYMQEPDQIERKSLFNSRFVQRGEQLLKICTQKMNQKIYDQKDQILLSIIKKWITPEEIKFIKQAVQPLQNQPLIFSHNDLLANNIIVKNLNNKFVFIDYEYCTFNYPIYDIANYFNEYEIDFNIKTENGFYRNEIPQNIQELRRKFIECYCLASHRTYGQYRRALESQEEKDKVAYEVEKMMRQFHLGVMLSNLMWGWWAIIVCKNPNIDFDYLEYCITKYESYLKIKKSGLWKIYSQQ